MTTGRVCARATGSTRCTRACVRERERTTGSLSTAEQILAVRERDREREAIIEAGIRSRSVIRARVEIRSRSHRTFRAAFSRESRRSRGPRGARGRQAHLLCAARFDEWGRQ